MASSHLSTYLNDHLAGSVGALEILARLAESHAGTPMARTLTRLHDDIGAERQELERLMERLHITQSVPRKASAWLAEKAAQIKLHIDDASDGALRLFESLEAVAIGIEGKRALWGALAAVAEHKPELQRLDYQRLLQATDEQRRAIEELRLEAAKAALASG